jgi:hypothetical protein
MAREYPELSRRNALAFLGIAGAGSAAVVSESVGRGLETDGSVPALVEHVDVKKLADVFQRLADGLRSGHVVPEADESRKVLHLTSYVGVGHWFSQELRFRFFVTEPEKS